MRNKTKYILLSVLLILIVYPFRQKLGFLFIGSILFMITNFISIIGDMDFSKYRIYVTNFLRKLFNISHPRSSIY